MVWKWRTVVVGWRGVLNEATDFHRVATARRDSSSTPQDLLRISAATQSAPSSLADDAPSARTHTFQQFCGRLHDFFEIRLLNDEVIFCFGVGCYLGPSGDAGTHPTNNALPFDPEEE